MKTGTKIVVSAMALGLLTTGFVVSKILAVYDYPVAAAQLPSAVIEARKLGIPLTSDELLNRLAPARPPSDFLKFGVEDVASLFFDLQRQDPDWGAAERLLQSKHAELEGLREVARAGVVFPTRDWDMGGEVRVPESRRSAKAAMALCVSAMALSHRGKSMDAAEDLKLARAYAVPGSRETWLSGLLTQFDINNNVFRTAEFCLADAANLPDGLRAIRQAALEPEPRYDLRSYFRGWAFLGVTTTRNLEEFGGLRALLGSPTSTPTPPPDPRSLQRSGEPTRLSDRAYMARVLQYWIKVFKYINAHPDDTAGLKTLGDGLESELQDHKDATSWMVNTVVCPDIAGIAQSRATALSKYRSRMALALVLEFRCAHGHFPKSLSQVGSEFIDPFGGKPLRYRTDGKSVTVWSVGRDLIDDDGISWRSAGTGDPRDDHRDIVAAYPPIRSKPTP